MRIVAIMIGFFILSTGTVRADENSSAPRPVPLTRPEMKRLLEEMKARKPRIPLPPMTEKEQEALGERAGYEARLRYNYMSSGETRRGGGGGRQPRTGDRTATLDFAFKTMMFWIVSRTNNCQYCLGHQEWKLASAGLEEERVAALDGDWSEFTPAQRTAFGFARKLTHEPHRIGDKDIELLRKHYKDLQILEMILSVAGNNSINRWKEGVGVPQSKEGSSFARRAEKPIPADRPSPIKSFLTPTPERFRDQISRVAPLTIDEKTGKPTRQTVCVRPALESRAEVEKALQACQKRTPRLPLVEPATARGLLPDDWSKGSMPQWVRLLANFPREGKSRILSVRAAEETGNLESVLKAQVSWIIARQDRAWYAVGCAKKRLRELGVSAEDIYKLDGSWKEFTPAQRALFTVARKLAATPIVLTDDDVALAVKLTSPRDVVQLINYTTGRAFFDRLTEAAGLQLEE
jgi:alkylhydroperoxidase family enzyme